jgi:hypothetical protein
MPVKAEVGGELSERNSPLSENPGPFVELST